MDELNLPTISGIRKIVEPLHERLKSLELTLAASLRETKKVKSKHEYYRNSDLKKMFGLTNNTIIKYRDNGILPFTLLGGVYLYDANAIDEMLEQNKSNTGRRLFYERAN
jgi:hypothetical protein